MKMKSISIPEYLHTWLYKNITAERKSLYAVIEWLRDCKEHSDRVHSEHTNIDTPEALVRFEGDKPLHSEYVEFIGNTGKVRTTHDMTKAIGFRVFDPTTCEQDQILITFDVAESLRNKNLNDKKDDTQ